MRKCDVTNEAINYPPRTVVYDTFNVSPFETTLSPAEKRPAEYRVPVVGPTVKLFLLGFVVKNAPLTVPELVIENTVALDEAIALPTDFSARIARNTQLYLQKEIGITNYIDPTGGADYIEFLTEQLIVKAKALIREVDELGGMAKAIETGIPKMRIEEASAEKQSRIDAVVDVIVGVNRFVASEQEEIELRENPWP